MEDPRRWACVDPNDANSFTTGSMIGTLEYDGLNRRLVKAVGDGDANSCEVGDREETYQTYWDDWSMVEVRNGSDKVLKFRRAGIWGLTYIDELDQIAVNADLGATLQSHSSLGSCPSRSTESWPGRPTGKALRDQLLDEEVRRMTNSTLVRQIPCFVVSGLAGAGLLIALACNGTDTMTHETDRHSDFGQRILTVEAVRDALVSLIQASPETSPIRATLDAVKSQAPQAISGGRVSIGPWECDLARRRFMFAVINPPVFFSQTGDFVKTSSGKWKAVVTNTMWGQK